MTRVFRSKSANSSFRKVGVATEIGKGHLPNISLKGSTTILSMLFCMKFCPPPRYSNPQSKGRWIFKFIQSSQAWTTVRCNETSRFEELKVRAVHRSRHSRGNLHLFHFLSILFSNTVSLCSTILVCSDTNYSHRVYSRHRIHPQLIIS